MPKRGVPRKYSPRVRSKAGRPRNPVEFNVETFEKVARDLQKGTIPLDRVTVSDSEVAGLRAIVHDTGEISFHVHYRLDTGDGFIRPYLKIGNHPQMTVPRARKLAKTIIELGDEGIDVQEGLIDRLLRELEDKGTRWRP